MNRLQAELHRLYLPHADDPQTTRTMLLELGRPASWAELARAWQGVQAELEWPAPAIAVSGVDSYQLWFSLAQPLAGEQAMALLEQLRRRYLPDVPIHRVAMTHAVDALPPLERAPGRWSAFVTPDLAALFADEPSLDLPPSPDAQADLLSRLQSIRPDDLKRALEHLTPATPPSLPQEPSQAAAVDGADPRRFLLEVMNDRGVDMHLRIEAAKALLPYSEGPRSL